MTDTDPLLAAVETLTKPVVGIAQKNEKTGRWERVHEVRQDPLLTQMREAVWPSGESNDGSALSASERMPLDSHMLIEYAKIATQITSWAATAGVKPSRNPITDLNTWYRAVHRDRDFDPGWAIRQLNGWAHHMRRLLAKPKSFIIEAACPICGTTQWGDRIHGGGMYPIKIEYVLDEDGRTPKDLSALCQFCKTVWDGRDSVMELHDELTEKGSLST
ncbi:hypothetical protein ATY41_10775 [Leifsonia xyli subsp. xyli]|uniref:DUF7341 domain-containing protein n=2 Tax=Leifsonia xyli subsp. xyli TaxID=59736 RepID=Q6AGU4_LEIXX|nr:hypothetical protein [Leifsonia xyli]AAT88401.1 hypothetical protein Lxx03970 [Leifsonia xyli subsp. xyli str. CTCB07]ODA90235.1 hypothetical protein ATY41_10775 [Leifsonia xyli subsp. xyli]